MTIENSGITYATPTAKLLHVSPLVNAEIAGRVAYDSFEHSEHEQVKEFNGFPVAEVDHSKLMDQLCHVYFHDSVAEHINLTFYLNTSRGVLQEIARHRIASYTVRSTRYTMSAIINAFVADKTKNISNTIPSDWFIETLLDMDLFITTDKDYNALQITDIWNRLNLQYKKLGTEKFRKTAVAKSSMEIFDGLVEGNPSAIFEYLQEGKKKRNVGDSFKHIVNDNWKVDLVMTMNLRSLKNFYQLRDSGAAYFLIKALAKAMKEVTPKRYLDLIVKEK